jgi:hypothetical protein
VLRIAAGTAPRRDRQRHRRGGAGQRRTDQHARAHRHADQAARRRQHHEAGDIAGRPRHHQAAEAEPTGQRAGDRLEQAPGDVLDGDGDGEIGDLEREIAGQGLEEQPQALAQPQREAQHQGDGNRWQPRRASASARSTTISPRRTR